jgi:hypothetical protein
MSKKLGSLESKLKILAFEKSKALFILGHSDEG